MREFQHRAMSRPCEGTTGIQGVVNMLTDPNKLKLSHEELMKNTPKEMVIKPQWLLWKEVKKEDDKPTKVPLAPWKSHNYGAMDATNPDNWTDYQTALDYFKKSKGKASGLGFVLGNGIVGIDLDHCINEKEELSDFALKTINSTETYIEVSPSGRGLHIIGFGEIPHALALKKGDTGLEIYGEKRYFTFTGNALKGRKELIQIQDLLEELYSEYDTEAIDIKTLLKGAERGQRNNAGIKLVSYYRRLGKIDEETLELLKVWNEKNTPSLKPDELCGIIRSAYRREKPYNYKFCPSPEEELRKKRKNKKKGEEEEIENPEDILRRPSPKEVERGIYFTAKRGEEGKIKDYVFKIWLNSVEPHIETVETKKRKTIFIPSETQPSENFYWVLKKKEDFDMKELYKELKELQGKYLYLEKDEDYDILAIAPIASYFRDIFRTIPYMDITATTKNSGKTTALFCLIWASFYGVLSVNLTPSVLFRAVDGCHGAVGIDELDQYTGEGKENSEIMTLLKGGYKKGLPAYRVEEGANKERNVVPYDAFGLKAWTRLNPLPAQLEDRAITIRMVKNRGFKALYRKIPCPEDFTDVRDKLYVYSLRHKEDVQRAYENLLENEKVIEGREAEKWIPLLTIAQMIDEELFNKLHKFAMEKETVEELDERTQALLYTLIENKLVGSQSSQDIKPLYKAELGAEAILSKWEEANGVKTREITQGLKRLGFERDKKKTGRKAWFNIEKKKLEILTLIYFPETSLTSLTSLLGTTESEKSEKSEVLGEDSEVVYLKEKELHDTKTKIEVFRCEAQKMCNKNKEIDWFQARMICNDLNIEHPDSFIEHLISDGFLGRAGIDKLKILKEIVDNTETDQKEWEEPGAVVEILQKNKKKEGKKVGS